MDKRPSLRHAMDYLHTWAGVLFSVLLFLVFFMGTLSVFDREIDRWMMPASRLVTPGAVSFDRSALPHLQQLASDARTWSVEYPNARDPLMTLGWFGEQGIERRLVDVERDRLLADPGTKGGSGFFYPFHTSFHLPWMDIGTWLLALVALAMLVLLVSGVIIHKRIFADFFTFRPRKAMQRATLDLHNASSILLLPFHFVITLSGLIIFLFVYLDLGVSVVYATDGGNIFKEGIRHYSRPPAREPGQLASIDAMVAQSRAIWGSGEVRRIIVRNPQDKHATVEVQRLPLDQVVNDNVSVVFDGPTGEVLARQRLSPGFQVQRFFSGLHMLSFAHWGLRWMYFVMGLISCVMIGTGLLLWVEKRRARQEKTGRISYRVVNAVAVAGTMGVLVATLSMLVANKLLPAGMGARAACEQWVFFGAWGATMLHASTRALSRCAPADLRTAWRELAWLSAALAVLAVILNGLLTGDHLPRALASGSLAVAGTDLVLLASALVAVCAARRLAARPVSAASGAIAAVLA
ncbi:PepSY domain-containing protein [Massilia sp. CCM 8695]|uniref:PepSY domain-containing protein n=1 Tax=Massilia frigida TaxID=2609281 RepID=A0ABX0NJK8_9BURK|nr:PepSY-associated TM helix domain-containing protein [Massilia frigida]NHZ83270.1 PepSY domain-containing protein [Massilia frigida]